MVTIRAGQSVGIGLFLLAIVIFAAFWGLFAGPFDTFYTIASDDVTNSTAQSGLDNSKTIYDSLPTVALGISAIGLLMWAVFTSEVGRR